MKSFVSAFSCAGAFSQEHNLFLMRHGALPPNPEKRFIGQRNIPLSPLGRKQMQGWATAFAQVPLHVIFCSPLSRCTESAALVRGKRDIPIIPIQNLCELSLGEWEGLTPQQVELRYPGAYAARGADFAGYCAAGGESFNQLALRVLPTFDKLVADHAGANMLVLAHYGVLGVLLARYMAVPLANILDIHVPYAGCVALPKQL